MNMTNSVGAMTAYSDALADAGEHSTIATGAMMRILNQQRKTAVRDAVRLELTNRMNARIATGTAWQRDRPRPQLAYLTNSMANARRHEKRCVAMSLHGATS